AGEKGYTTLERITVRPTLDGNGIWGGYTGPGAKTVLPGLAHAKVSMRLVPDQDPDEIFERFEAYLHKLAPSSVRARVTNHHTALPFIMDPAHPMLDAARRALARVWSKPPAMVR